MLECFSTVVTKRWEKLTSINAKVSILIHNQRTTLASKYYKIGTSAQLVDDLKKILNRSTYTQISLWLPTVWFGHPIQGFTFVSHFVRLCMHPPVRRELSLAWPCRKKTSMGVPRADSSVSTERHSIPSIYGVSRGFNHYSFFIKYFSWDRNEA
jgi:hypothetical protein